MSTKKTYLEKVLMPEVGSSATEEAKKLKAKKKQEDKIIELNRKTELKRMEIRAMRTPELEQYVDDDPKMSDFSTNEKDRAVKILLEAFDKIENLPPLGNPHMKNPDRSLQVVPPATKNNDEHIEYKPEDILKMVSEYQDQGEITEGEAMAKTALNSAMADLIRGKITTDTFNDLKNKLARFSAVNVNKMEVKQSNTVLFDKNHLNYKPDTKIIKLF